MVNERAAMNDMSIAAAHREIRTRYVGGFYGQLVSGFLNGVPMFWALGGLLVGAGIVIAMYGSASFSVGAWCTGAVLLMFAAVGRAMAQREDRIAPSASARARSSLPSPGGCFGLYHGFCFFVFGKKTTLTP
jgi:hypothetical protein